MQKISVETWPRLTELEKLFYEKNSYENLLAYMANNKIMNTSTYFEEYQALMETYYILCRELEKEIIIPVVGEEPVNWEVDFIDKVVEIREATK